jgi:hypothetical protein
VPPVPVPILSPQDGTKVADSVALAYVQPACFRKMAHSRSCWMAGGVRFAKVRYGSNPVLRPSGCTTGWNCYE